MSVSASLHRKPRAPSERKPAGKSLLFATVSPKKHRRRKEQSNDVGLCAAIIADDSSSCCPYAVPRQSTLPVGLSKTDTSLSNKIGDDGKTGHTALDRRFSLSWLRNRHMTDSPVNTIGPLGLRPLHLSAEPLIDLIFVHGLRGGSIKTWRKGDDPRLCWPQYWLPLDPDFQHANIHSFGYNADYSDTKDSILNVQDFGRALLGEMRTSPHLRRSKTDPIILIGHSMGGLVLKMAYTLARQDMHNPEIGQRIRCLFFLATPHRGSDFAVLLNNILRATGVLSARPYVADLQRNSASAQKINRDFEIYAQDVALWSFFETLKTSLGVTSSMIVDRDSAILGYQHENVQYLNGDHRGICKYDSPEDPNYIAVKNALATAIDSILGGVSLSKDEKYRAQIRSLRSYLDVSDQPDNDFANQEEIKATGSCGWFEERENFQAWRDVFDDTLGEKHDHIPQIYWLSARPGTGKTVLAGHIVAHLQSFHLDCAYYFFHHGNKSGQVLSGLLRSLAYQMALSNAGIREKLLQLKDDGAILDKDDERSIWRKVFLNGILQTKVYRPQYWVIDALDECIKYPEFFTLLSKLEVAFPLRILVTSRIIPEIQTYLARFGTSVISTEIRPEDSMKDIEAYIQTKIEAIPLDGNHQKQDLANKILAKSGGSFLWVHLVLHELSSVYTDKSIWTVLDEIPEGMVPFYQRTISMMSRNSREIDVTKAILLWTVYSARPLRTSELQQALILDIGASVLSIKKTIEGLCGQLVYVDRSDTVQMVHATAREFLIGDKTSEFAVPKQKGHERIALSCLRYLSSDEMKPPRNRRFLNAPRGEPSPFRDYACTAFSEHVFSAFSEADSLLTALDLFLKTNVLSWIEHVAQKDSLYYLSRTAKNLKGYLERRAKYLSPLGSQVERVDGWLTDLARLVSKFGVALTTSPSSIYFLIPPLCPTTSATFKQFGKSPDGLVLSGIKNIAWEDCISWIDFNNSATSLASGDKAFAVGMETGDIEIYNRGSCQWERTIQHQEPLDVLRFDTSGDFLASCGSKSIKLWNINGTTLWIHKLTSRIIEIAFGTNSLVGVSMNGQVTTWNLKSGDVMGDPYRYRYKSPDDASGGTRVKAPQTASLSPDFEMIAFGYRTPDVGLWSFQDHEFVGWCICPGVNNSSIVLFNPNPNIIILAVGYKDSTLAIFDPWSQELIHHVKTGTGTQEVSSLASSPDGRTMVTVDSCGTMQVWDFETLTLLYHVKSSDLGFRLVAFSSNGLRVVDLMDSKLKVWEPAVLIRKTVEEDVSVSDATILPVVEGQDESKRRVGITVMVCHPTLSVIFVGKYDGSVAAYSSKTGTEDAVLYSHSKNAFVTAVAISSHHILASGDVNGNVQVWQLRQTATRTLKTSFLMLNTLAGKAIKQLLISPTGEFVLVSTTVSDFVFSTRDSICIGKIAFSPTDRTLWKWLSRASAQPELLLIVDDKVKRYCWDKFPSPSSSHSLILPLDSQHQIKDTSIRSATLDLDGQNLIIDFHQENDTIAAKALLILSVGTNLSSVSLTKPTVLAHNPAHLGLGDHVKYFLELFGSRMLFIDSASWLSSVDLNTGITTEGAGEYTRHFFVPNEFVARETGVLPVRSVDNDVIFAANGELAVVRNGLKFQNVTKVSDDGRKRSYPSGMGDEKLYKLSSSDESRTSDDGRKPSFASGMSGETRRPSYMSGMSEDVRKPSYASGMSDDIGKWRW